MKPRVSDYGRRQQDRRRRWEPFVAAGQVDCAYCGGRIWPGQAWDLGHSVDRSEVAPEHRHCNRATAKRRLRHSREW